MKLYDSALTADFLQLISLSEYKKQLRTMCLEEGGFPHLEGKDLYALAF